METEAIKNKTQSDKKGKVLKNVAVAGAAAVAGAGAVYGAETILDSDPVVDSAHGTTPEENPTQQEQQEQAQQEQQAQQPQHTENVAPSQSQHQNGGQTDAPAPQGNEVNTNSGGTASTGGGQTGSTQQGGEGSVIDNVNPNDVAQEIIEGNYIDPDDIDMEDLAFTEVGTIETIDGQVFSAAQMTGEEGEQLFMVDLNGDGTLDILTTEQGDAVVEVPSTLTVDDVESIVTQNDEDPQYLGMTEETPSQGLDGDIMDNITNLDA